MRQSTFLRSALRALMSAGWYVRVADNVQIDGKRSIASVLSDVMDVARELDYLTIRVRKLDESESGTLFIVWQGPDNTYEDGEEIIADYSMNLDPVLGPLYDSLDA